MAFFMSKMNEKKTPYFVFGKFQKEKYKKKLKKNKMMFNDKKIKIMK